MLGPLLLPSCSQGEESHNYLHSKTLVQKWEDATISDTCPPVQGAGDWWKRPHPSVSARQWDSVATAPLACPAGNWEGAVLSSHTCVSRLGREYRHGVHQCLCLQGTFQPSPAPPDDSFGLASESSSHIVWVLYKLLCPQLQGLGANKTTHKAYKRGVWVICSTLGPLYISPLGFLSQKFWGLFSLVHFPGVGCKVWDTTPSLL